MLVFLLFSFSFNYVISSQLTALSHKCRKSVWAVEMTHTHTHTDRRVLQHFVSPAEAARDNEVDVDFPEKFRKKCVLD